MIENISRKVHINAALAHEIVLEVISKSGLSLYLSGVQPSEDTTILRPPKSSDAGNNFLHADLLVRFTIRYIWWMWGARPSFI